MPANGERSNVSRPSLSKMPHENQRGATEGKGLQSRVATRLCNPEPAPCRSLRQYEYFRENWITRGLPTVDVIAVNTDGGVSTSFCEVMANDG